MLLEHAPWLFWIVFPFWVFYLWHRFRDGNLRYARQRSQRLYALTRSGKWAQADPAALQLAVRDAYGAVIDDAWIGLALRRGNPLRMLSDCRLAVGMIRIRADGMRFEPVKNRLGIRNFRKAASVSFVAACLPWIIMWILIIFSHPAKSTVATLAVASLLFAPFFMFMSVCHESVHRLVVHLDDLYPLRVQNADTAVIATKPPRRRVRETRSDPAA
jgi:hypothetical protein